MLIFNFNLSHFITNYKIKLDKQISSINISIIKNIKMYKSDLLNYKNI